MASKNLRGRVELCVGRLGAGKTTAAAMRVRELAAGSGRQMATTGKDWPAEWAPMGTLLDLYNLRDSVLLWDEIHLWAPSSRGLVSKEHELILLLVLSLARKRGNCIVGTTQAYTRVATHVRQLVTTVWWPRPIVPGRWHSMRMTTPPEDGQDQIGMVRWFVPATAKIPTNSEVFLPPSLFDMDEVHKILGLAAEAGEITGASPEPLQEAAAMTRGSSWAASTNQAS